MEMQDAHESYQEWHSYHASCVYNSIEPESLRHLFFSKICSSHVNHYFPVRLNKSIGRLVFGRSSNNLQFIIDKIFTDGHPKKFMVTITVEAARKRTGGSTE
jgi:hypothetical protein